MQYSQTNDEVSLDSEVFPLLARLNTPQDLKTFSLDELEALAAEIRRMIIQTVSHNGGHLASPLGVVELTIALWYVFDLEQDHLIWDVGHQSYAHKILSGRKDRFSSLRLKGGISGYPRRSESPYDAFGTGHSSTSISAAVGMAVARDQKHENRHIIAVIGDGAMTGGMALEALNHAGHLGTDMLVILNDNEMSIAKNVGALSSYFTRLITARQYKRAKEDVTSFVKRILGPRLSQTAHRLEVSVKGFLTAGGFFQELGFNYVGPVDGHDLPALVGLFSNLKRMHGPILLHCATVKGKGYQDAEDDPMRWHGVKPFPLKVIEGEGEARPPEKLDMHPRPVAKTFTDVFADAAIEKAESDESVVAITAAMPTGTGLDRFQERFPDRFFDVAICEQHAVTFAAGLAAGGLRPICALYSTFLQRGYDQLIHDVCLQNLPVVFAIDRAGLVGEDSPTHVGAFDMSFLRVTPNLQILVPRDDVDLREMLRYALTQPGPVAIRYPRDVASTIGNIVRPKVTRTELLRKGTDALLFSAGPCASTCLRVADLLAAEGFSIGVADVRCIRPLDEAFLDTLPPLPLITVEENTLAGGFGSAILEYYERTERLNEVQITRLGLPDAFVEHAKRQEQLVECGLDPVSIASSVRAVVARKSDQCAARKQAL